WHRLVKPRGRLAAWATTRTPKASRSVIGTAKRATRPWFRPRASSAAASSSCSTNAPCSTLANRRTRVARICSLSRRAGQSRVTTSATRRPFVRTSTAPTSHDSGSAARSATCRATSSTVPPVLSIMSRIAWTTSSSSASSLSGGTCSRSATRRAARGTSVASGSDSGCWPPNTTRCSPPTGTRKAWVAQYGPTIRSGSPGELTWAGLLALSTWVASGSPSRGRSTMPIQPAPRPVPPTRLSAVGETRKTRVSVLGFAAGSSGTGSAYTRGSGAAFDDAFARVFGAAVFGVASIDMPPASWPWVPRGNDWTMVPCLTAGVRVDLRWVGLAHGARFGLGRAHSGRVLQEEHEHCREHCRADADPERRGDPEGKRLVDRFDDRGDQRLHERPECRRHLGENLGPEVAGAR